MGKPSHYKTIDASGEIIDTCKAIKDSLDLTWNEFLDGCIDLGLSGIDREELESVAEHCGVEDIRDSSDEALIQAIRDSFEKPD